MSIQGRIFTDAYNSIFSVIPYDKAWSNTTGYFDYLVDLVKLAPGKIAKSMDPNMRRMILIGTRFGTIVVFDRYSGQIENGVWVCNRPHSKVIDSLTSGTSIGQGEMVTLLGSWGNLNNNIGSTIEKMAAELLAESSV